MSYWKHDQANLIYWYHWLFLWALKTRRDGRWDSVRNEWRYMYYKRGFGRIWVLQEDVKEPCQ
jgi:hypothetical protein